MPATLTPRRTTRACRICGGEFPTTDGLGRRSYCRTCRPLGRAERARNRREPPAPPSAWQATRLRVLARDRWRCQCCGRRAFTAAWVRPRRLGGADVDDNLFGACGACALAGLALDAGDVAGKCAAIAAARKLRRA